MDLPQVCLWLVKHITISTSPTPNILKSISLCWRIYISGLNAQLLHLSFILRVSSYMNKRKPDNFFTSNIFFCFTSYRSKELEHKHEVRQAHTLLLLLHIYQSFCSCCIRIRKQVSFIMYLCYIHLILDKSLKIFWVDLVDLKLFEIFE